MKKTVRSFGVAIAVSVLALTGAACSSTSGGADDSASADPVVTATETATDPVSPWENDYTDSDPFTALVVEMTWLEQDEQHKQDMCDGITLFGPEVAAEFLREGAQSADPDGDVSDSQVDYDLAARMYEEKCVAEGY